MKDNRNFRLVILDYTKKILKNEQAHQVFTDLLKYRQMNFERSTESYVYVDKLDLIGTHYLVYDTRDLFAPKIIAGIRTSYSSRCDAHRVKIPLEDIIPNAALPTQEAYRKFKDEFGPLVECNGWFIDTEFSSSKAAINLPDVLFFGITTYLLRQGINHFIGATNERFKASRHVARVGRFEDGHIVINPSFPGDHKLTLVHPFHSQWLKECVQQYGALMHNRLELRPSEPEIKTYAEIEAEILGTSVAA